MENNQILNKANNKSNVLCFAEEGKFKLLDFETLSGLLYYEGISHNEKDSAVKKADCVPYVPGPYCRRHLTSLDLGCFSFIKAGV